MGLRFFILMGSGTEKPPGFFHFAALDSEAPQPNAAEGSLKIQNIRFPAVSPSLLICVQRDSVSSLLFQELLERATVDLDSVTEVPVQDSVLPPWSGCSCPPARHGQQDLALQAFLSLLNSLDTQTALHLGSGLELVLCFL